MRSISTVSYTHLKEGIRKITEEDKEKIQRQNQEFSMEGLRVLAFTYREIPKNHTLTIQDEDHLVFLGLIAMMDPPREDVYKRQTLYCIDIR